MAANIYTLLLHLIIYAIKVVQIAGYPADVWLKPVDFDYSVRDALLGLNLKSSQYQYFPIDISPDVEKAIREARVLRPIVIQLVYGLSDFSTDLYDSLQHVLCVDVCEIGGNISLLFPFIEHTISNLVFSSGRSMAFVSIIAYNDGEDDALYQPCWHLDVTFDQQCGLPNPLPIGNDFLYTLLGNTTLYRNLDRTSREYFNRYAAVTPHSVTFDQKSASSDPNLSILLNDLSVSNVFAQYNSTETDHLAGHYGSVHYTGRQYGTLHSTPPGKERLLITVSPQSAAALECWIQQGRAEL